jgi:hypothetical protein
LKLILFGVDLNLDLRIRGRLPDFSDRRHNRELGADAFSQVMDFVPWTSFERIVARYGGDVRVRSLRCGEQFRIMAFAQMAPAALPAAASRTPSRWSGNTRSPW